MGKHLFSILLILSVLAAESAHSRRIRANSTHDATSSELEVNVPNILPFENRAACAVDSKKPSNSAFLIVDSYNAGKQIDSWLQGKDYSNDLNITVDQGLKIFRLSLTEIWMIISKEILNGRLPLLKADPSYSKKVEANYSRILKQCESKFPCAEMDDYLGAIFENWKNIPKEDENAYQAYESIDKLARRAELLKGGSNPQLSCLYVKRFSELQSNWNHDRPDQALLQKIALTS